MSVMCNGCTSTVAQIHIDGAAYHPVCGDCLRRLKRPKWGERFSGLFLAALVVWIVSALGVALGFLFAAGKS